MATNHNNFAARCSEGLNFCREIEAIFEVQVQDGHVRGELGVCHQFGPAHGADDHLDVVLARRQMRGKRVHNELIIIDNGDANFR